MRTQIALLSVLAAVGFVSAQQLTTEEAPEGHRDATAVSILEQVDQATRAVTSVRYTAVSEPSGVAVNFVSAAEGETVMSGWGGNLPEKFRTSVKTTTPGSEEQIELTGGGNGDTYFLIDHTTKKAYADMDPGVLGSSARAIQGFGMVEFVHEAPFDDELGAPTIELLEEVEIHGEACHQIRVVYGGGQGESIWAFSKSDYLPRKRVRVFSIPGQGDGRLENTILGLEVDPQIDPAVFEFKLPAGYEQIDDFAP
jgi:hypothetical protein